MPSWKTYIWIEENCIILFLNRHNYILMRYMCAWWALCNFSYHFYSHFLVLTDFPPGNFFWSQQLFLKLSFIKICHQKVCITIHTDPVKYLKLYFVQYLVDIKYWYLTSIEHVCAFLWNVKYPISTHVNLLWWPGLHQGKTGNHALSIIWKF